MAREKLGTSGLTEHSDRSVSSNFTPQVKEARNQSQIFNRKSISRSTTHRQSYHLQAMLTGVKRRKANISSEKVNIGLFRSGFNKRMREKCAFLPNV